VIENLFDRIRLLFRKEKESYLCLYHILGFFPHQIKYYKEALLHKSLQTKTEGGHLVNNERLEFLGDAVLDAVVGDLVFYHFPEQREGFLTNTRSKIVQRETLNRLAVDIGLDKLLQRNYHSQTHNTYINGNAFEALMGAIYLDRGYGKCMEFFKRQILGKHISLDQVAHREINFKSKLIEWAQKNHRAIDFKLLEQSSDEDANPVFCTLVAIEGVPAGKGKGYTKKESQQKAAKNTLRKIRYDADFKRQVKAAAGGQKNEDVPADTPSD